MMQNSSINNINTQCFQANQISEENQSSTNNNQFPLDLGIYELTAIVLEYAYVGAYGQAAPLKAREIWYRSLVKELDGSLDCHSSVQDPNSYWRETSQKILDYVAATTKPEFEVNLDFSFIGLGSENIKIREILEKSASSSPFDLTHIFSIIHLIKIEIDQNLVTIFNKIFKKAKIHSDFSICEDNFTDAANRIRNYINLPITRDRLKKFTYLNVGHDCFKILPKELFELENLQAFSIHHCHVHIIPSAIGSLKKLDTLGLDGNCLRTLPWNINKLTNLDYISLNNNRFESIPAEIAHLPKLNDLFIRENPLKNLPINFRELIERKCKLDLPQEEIEKLIG